MARVNTQRAHLRLAVAVLVGCQPLATVCAQAPVMAQPQQPMWVSPGVAQGPVMQAGPDGTINLDQMIMGQPQFGGAPYYAGQPMMAPTAAPQYAPAPYGTPYAQQQPWGQPVVQQQSTWGPPLLQIPNPAALTAGPIPPVYVHRTSLFGEFLFMRVRDAEVAYALPIDGPVAPVLGNEVPVGPVAIVDPSYDIGFRAGGNFALSPGASLAAQYTRFRSEDSNSVTVTAPDVLRSLVSHPLGANAATDTLDASATLDVDLDQIDLDFRSLWLGCECPSCAYSLSSIVGATAVRIDHDFVSSYRTIGVTTVDTDVKFEGVGMRIGLQGERIFPASGVFVYGTGISNFYFGTFDTDYLQANSFNGTEAATSWSAGRIVPSVELELGAGWLGVNRHLRLSAGYRMVAFFNMVKTDQWIRAVQNHDFTNMDGTLTFDGLVARAEWLF